ncbi:extracellular solute-binding protein [Paenibacillus roseipurpureus]|uniref:Extracellular solute-binding protein n=1 Tax=Paenibacillus roseopurpureus TaxID=2918901 RepID=A0AA96LKJ1_9BACL|nr:extracellular solute-binding protein [Paenibacillus sp. MBLB1832]WNR43455.1 extracellular solute-binding protein [Paenibacillus sp. MBLB1832]
MKRISQKLLLSTTSMILLTSVLAACGSQGEKPAKSQETPKGPLTVSMMNWYNTPEPPKTDNPIVRKIEELTNTKLNITWIPASAYNDKINVSIASNDLPKVLMVLDSKSSSIINAERSGMFWEIGPLLKSYPNLAKYNANEAVLNNVSVDGKVYGLYRARALARQGVSFRQDWLENLGLAQPKTIDELYNVIKSFTLNDPDKNGKNDTIGLVEAEDSASGAAATGLSGFPTIASFFGAANQWEFQNGKAVPMWTTKENMDAMKFYKKLYDEKLINLDFAATKTSKQNEQFYQGKAGMVFNTLDFIITGGNELKKVNPNAKLDILSKIQGPKGERVFATSGYNGMFLFPKSTVKSEAELKQVLEFFDKLVSDEMLSTWTWGIENMHFKKDANGEPAISDQTAYTNDVSPIKQLPSYDGSLMIWKGKGAADNKFRTMMKDNQAIAVSNPVEPLISQTAVEKGTELNKIISDARVKFILGNLDEVGFNKEVEKWRAQGGDKMIAEYSEQYAKLKK